MLAASGLFKLLGDDARLRLLRLLTTDRLNVTELTAILGIAQSGVSRHLGLLREAGLIEEERGGGFTYYRATRERGGARLGSVWGFLAEQFTDATADDLIRADDARLREVLRQRRERRDAHGIGADGDPRQLVPGRSWTAWSRALALLLPELCVADLGCGEGYLTLEVARWARRVIAVDRSASVLDRARAVARRSGVSNVDWKRGEIERLPLDDASVDVALLSQALHHAEAPARALAEAFRVLVDGGRVLVLDLATHEQEWVRDRLGDRWTGFDPAALDAMMRDAGLRDVTVQPVLPGDPFAVLTAIGTKQTS